MGNDKAGKTTMAQSLYKIAHRGCRCRAELLSFADSVREEINDLYGIPDEIVANKSIDKDKTIINMADYLYDDSLPLLWKKFKLIKKVVDFHNLQISLRDVLINHSTHIRRKQDPRYWVKKFAEKVDKIKDHFDLIVIDDARFDTEFEYILDQSSFYIYHVTNGSKNSANVAQDSINKWIAENPDKITARLEVGIPLLQYDADKINISNVLRNIPDIRVKREVPTLTSIPRFNRESIERPESYDRTNQ